MALGGLLADPVKHLPSIFGEGGLFDSARNPGGVVWAMKYPYALPMVVNSIVITCSLLLATFGLRETAPCRVEGKGFRKSVWKRIVDLSRTLLQMTSLNHYTAIKLDEEQLETPEEKEITNKKSFLFSTIWTPNLLRALVSFALLPLHNAAFTHLFSVFLSTPISTQPPKNAFSFVGGLGLSPQSIGLCISLLGLSGILLKFFTYPLLQSCLGSLKTLRLALCMFPLAYIATPYLALFSENSIWRWPCVICVLFTQVMARGFAIPSSIMILTDAAPRKEVLGTVHGAGNMLGSLSKSVAPVIGGLVFAWGMDTTCIGAVWWLWLSPIAFIALAWSYLLTDADEKDDLLSSEA